MWHVLHCAELSIPSMVDFFRSFTAFSCLKRTYYDKGPPEWTLSGAHHRHFSIWSIIGAMFLNPTYEYLYPMFNMLHCYIHSVTSCTQHATLFIHHASWYLHHATSENIWTFKSQICVSSVKVGFYGNLWKPMSSLQLITRCLINYIPQNHLYM